MYFALDFPTGPRDYCKQAIPVNREVKKTLSTSVAFVTGLPDHLSSGATFSLVFVLLLLSLWKPSTLVFTCVAIFTSRWALAFLKISTTRQHLCSPPDTCTCFHLQNTSFLCLCLAASSLFILCTLCLVSACWHGPFSSLEEMTLKHPLAVLDSSSLQDHIPWNSSSQISGQILLSRSPRWSCCLPYSII